MLRQNTSTKRVFHPVYRQNTPTKGYFILIETKHPDYMCILFWKQYCGAPPSYVSFYGRKHCGMFAWLYASRTIFGPNRANCARFKTLCKLKFKTGKYYFHFFFKRSRDLEHEPKSSKAAWTCKAQWRFYVIMENLKDLTETVSKRKEKK